MAFVNGTQPTELCGDQPHAVSSLPQYLQRAIYAPKRGEHEGRRGHASPTPRSSPAAAAEAGPEGGPPG